VNDDAAQAATTFIVRALRDARGRVHGIVERVKTGEKSRFAGADGLGGVIEKMLEPNVDGRSSALAAPLARRRHRARRARGDRERVARRPRPPRR
jgi:hypothetical protein